MKADQNKLDPLEQGAEPVEFAAMQAQLAEMAAKIVELSASKEEVAEEIRGLKALEVGQQILGVKKQWIPSHMKQPKFREGQRVRVKEGSPKSTTSCRDENGEISEKPSAYMGLVGEIQRVPSTEVRGQWKYRTRFPDIPGGIDAFLENDLIPA